MVRYPEIQVKIQSRNPFALVAAVREGMRRARIDSAEIYRFSEQALSDPDAQRVREICGQWVDLGFQG
jgi:hypothetical protein